MRSLSQLNTRGQTLLPYTDNRPAGVVYDRVTPTNQQQNVIAGGSFIFNPGIEVLSISQPDAINFYYFIDITDIYPGGTVTWPGGTPAGVTVTASLGEYRVYIDTVEQWQAMREPTITLPSGWNTDFIIYGSVDTDITSPKTWTNTVDITFGGFLTSTSSISARLTGIQKSVIAMSSLSTLSVIASKKQVASAALSAAATLAATSKYNPGQIKAAITASASITARGGYNPGRLRATITTTSTLIANAIKTPSAVANLSALSTALARNTDYFAVTTLTDDVANADSYFGTQLSMSWDASILAVGNNKNTSPNNSYVFTRSGTTWSQQTKINDDAQALGVSSDNTGPWLALGLESGGQVKLYKRSGSTWTLNRTVTPADTNTSFGQYVHVPWANSDSFSMFIGAPTTQDLYCEWYSNDPGYGIGWNQVKFGNSDYQLLNQNSVAASFTSGNGRVNDVAVIDQGSSDIRVQYYSRNGNSLTLKNDTSFFSTYTGDRKELALSIYRAAADERFMAIGFPSNNTSSASPGYVNVYRSNDSGSTWTLQSTLTSEYPTTDDKFGQSLAMYDSQLIVGAPGDRGGAVYIYNRSGSTWQLEVVLRPDNYAAGMRFGETVAINYDQTYIVIGAPNISSGTGSAYVYRRIPT